MIKREGLFAMDVDDAIWEDIEVDDDVVAPAWLCDEDTRRGIRYLHQLERCEEEEERLTYERCAIQEWFMEEWVSVNNAIMENGKLLSQ